jgi:FAD/FMN-containing dehydrogenase
MTQTLSAQDIANLKQAVGSGNVASDEDVRSFFSQDIWAVGEQAVGVIAPETTDALSEAVRTAHAAGVKLNPRGGGMSYTKGYTPDRDGIAMLDLSKMDKIVEINEAGMYVTVQAGCTWKTLYEALKPLGLRTPFWGPLSGISSTIGGGMSQNNAFFGAGTYGPSTDSCTGLTVVLADGTIVRTGTGGNSGAKRGAKPFFRQYGPDLTGLFLSDAGALGYKAEVTLRLIPLPQAEDWASYEYDDRDSWAKAQAELGRLGFACELFGFDPNLQAVRMKRASLMADVSALKNVVTGQKGGLLKGIKEGAKVALAGRSFMDDVAYSMHWVVEGHSDAEVAAKMETLHKIAKGCGGRVIDNSIPKIMRANPFTPLNNILGPQGERWVPIHGIVSMDDGVACLADIDALFATIREDLDSHGVTTGYLLTTLSTNGYLIEPVFIWPEEIHPIHESTVEPATLKRIKRFEKNDAATDAVRRARQGILDIFSEYGAAHFQIGRTYPYAKDRAGPNFDMLKAIKAALDPTNAVNPGSLGLG